MGIYNRKTLVERFNELVSEWSFYLNYAECIAFEKAVEDWYKSAPVENDIPTDPSFAELEALERKMRGY